MKKVGVVILNFKVKDETLECIKSVQKSSLKNTKIIVVDNDSGDGLEEEVKELDVDFIQTGDNLGYSGGNNVGIKKALEDKCDLILVLNPDTTIDKDAIKFLVEGADSAGIYGPKIYFGQGKTIWYAGGIFDKANVLGQHRGVDQKDDGQFDKVEETDFVTGAALFVSREVFEKIGLFDEKYFLYLEDLDLCYRAKQAGFKIGYLPDAVVYHKNAKSTGLGSPLQDYYITRNRMLFASKYLSFRTRFALFREAVRNLGKPVRRQAFFDFLMGSFGKGDIKG